MDWDLKLVFGGFVLFIVFLAGAVVGTCKTASEWQRKAVKAKAAEWATNEDGSATFRWKTSAAQSAEGE